MNRTALLSFLKLSLPFLFSAFFLWLAFRDISIAELWDSIRSASALTILLASVLAIVAIQLRAWRWQILLKPLKSIPFKKVYPITMIGFMANNLLPAHAGEVVRAYLIAREEQLSGMAAFATVGLERILDLVALASLLAVVMISVELPDWLRFSALALGVLALLMLGVLYFTSDSDSPIRHMLFRLINMLPEKLQIFVSDKLNSIMEGVHIIRSGPKLIKLLALSLLVWLQLAFTIWVVLIGYPLDPELSEFVMPSLTSVLLVAFAAAIPSSPGYVGVTQIAFVYALEPFGVNAAQAVGVSVIYHVTQYFPITLTGIWYLLRQGFTFKTLREARSESN
ncbi:MAG: lysylphosphatidylglycerol synthase transmembrane domain-containing protein [Calditrichota bacterium]